VPVKRLEIRWLKRALANVEAEAKYIARDNPAAAQRIVRAVEQAVELLARHPALGRPGRVEGTRELVVPGTPYLIPYRVREGRVEVLRVFHAARKWPPSL
jgi:toxin ParE1/3/4